MKQLINILLIGCFLLFQLPTQAQNAFNRTLSFANPQWQEPALLGINQQPIIGLSYRQNINQTGIGLSAYELGFSMPIQKNYNSEANNSGFALSSSNLENTLKESKASRRKHGIGLNLRSQRFDNYQRSEVQLGYAYHLPVSKSLNLSFGANFVYAMTTIGQNSLTVRDPANDALYQQILEDQGAFANEIFGNVGISIYTENFQFSSHLRRALLYSEGNIGQNEGEVPAFLPFFRTSYLLRLNTEWHLIPQVSYAMNGTFEDTMAGSIRLNYNNFLSAGVGIQNNEQLSALIGVKLSRDIFVQYAFDSYNNFGRRLANGVHELNISYLIQNKRATLPILG